MPANANQAHPDAADFERATQEIRSWRSQRPVEHALARNFTDFDRDTLARVRDRLREAGGEMFVGDAGQRDLEDHLYRRLERDRAQIIPWLSSVQPLEGARILEIGCGTGASTLALAEQGAQVVAIDIDLNSLRTAADRCRIMNRPGVDFRLLNATAIGEEFADRTFDFIIFFASLEHLLIPERLTALAAAWSLLPGGGHLVVVEAPNRLWFWDHHTAFLPFFHWLPDDLAHTYMMTFSSRKGLVDEFRQSEDGMTRCLRAGRGVSFHEFELAIGPAQDLHVVSSLGTFLRDRQADLRNVWAESTAQKFVELLAALYPPLHRGFFEQDVDLIIRKELAPQGPERHQGALGARTEP